MRYLGGKMRIAKKIAAYLNSISPIKNAAPINMIMSPMSIYSLT